MQGSGNAGDVQPVEGRLPVRQQRTQRTVVGGRHYRLGDVHNRRYRTRRQTTNGNARQSDDLQVGQRVARVRVTATRAATATFIATTMATATAGTIATATSTTIATATSTTVATAGLLCSARLAVGATDGHTDAGRWCRSAVAKQ